MIQKLLLALPPAVWVGIKAYKLVTDVLPSKPDLSDRRILVTGATAGLGLETAKVLAQLGAHVLITARDMDKGQRALREIQAVAPHSAAELLPLDLDSEASLRSLAQELLARCQPIHALVLNAATGLVPTRKTWANREQRVGVNHFSHCLLTWLLLPLLPPGEARVVTVSSSAVDGLVDVRKETGGLKDLCLRDAPYAPLTHYALSKAFNLMWGLELKERLAGKVACFVTHPGMSATELTSKTDPTHPLASPVLHALLSLLQMQSPAAGALSQIWAASAPLHELDKVGAMIGPNLLNCHNTGPWAPTNRVARQTQKARKQRALFFDATSCELGLKGDWRDRVGIGLLRSRL